LLLLVAAAGIRLFLIGRSRHEPLNVPHPPKVELSSDGYVVPTKLHAYDLASLRQLAGKPVWIRSGYQLAYYPYDRSTKHVDFNRKAGLLGPIEKIDVKDVVQQPTPEKLAWQTVPSSQSAPGSPSVPRSTIRIRIRSRELMAVFDKNGAGYAFTLGYGNGNENTIAADDILYYQDPHQLYHDWPADIWSAIDRHEATPGMSELEVQFAIGGAAGIESYSGSQRVLIYENNGNPLRVVFIDGKAQTIKPVP
jgi:hypothetical protein